MSPLYRLFCITETWKAKKKMCVNFPMGFSIIWNSIFCLYYCFSFDEVRTTPPTRRKGCWPQCSGVGNRICMQHSLIFVHGIWLCGACGPGGAHPMRDLWREEPEHPSKEVPVLLSKNPMTLKRIKMLRFPPYPQSHAGAMETEAKLWISRALRVHP